MITFYGIIMGLLLITGYLIITQLKQHQKMAMGLLLVGILIAASVSLYMLWGNFSDAKKWQQQGKQTFQLQQQLYMSGGVQGAIERIRAHLAVDSSDAKGWYLLGQLYFSQQQLEQAEQCYARAYTLQANELDYALAYVKTLLIVNTADSHQQAQQILNNAAENNKNNTDIMNMQAIQAYQMGNQQQAQAIWQQILDILPEDHPDRINYQQALN